MKRQNIKTKRSAEADSANSFEEASGTNLRIPKKSKRVQEAAPAAPVQKDDEDHEDLEESGSETSSEKDQLLQEQEDGDSNEASPAAGSGVNVGGHLWPPVPERPLILVNESAAKVETAATTKLTVPIKPVRLLKTTAEAIKAHVDYLRQLTLYNQETGMIASKVVSREVLTTLTGVALLKGRENSDVASYAIPELLEFLEQLLQKTDTDSGRDPEQKWADAQRQIPCQITHADQGKALKWYSDVIQMSQTMKSEFMMQENEPAVALLKARMHGKLDQNNSTLQPSRTQESRNFGITISELIEKKSRENKYPDLNIKTIQGYMNAFMKEARLYHDNTSSVNTLMGVRKSPLDLLTEVNATEEQTGREPKAAKPWEHHSSSETAEQKAQRLKAAPRDKPRTTTEAPDRCYGCGAKGHVQGECRGKTHPHWNSERVPWEDSKWGKRYALCTFTGKDGTTQKVKNMPYALMIDVTQKDWESKPHLVPRNREAAPAKANKSKSEYCGICHTITKQKISKISREVIYETKDVTIYDDATMSAQLCVTNDVNVLINVAFDTQSVPFNYINHRVKDLLGDNGRIRKLDKPLTVCSCFTNVCECIAEEYEILITLHDIRKNKNKLFSVKAYLIDSPQDVTIGLHGIASNKKIKSFLDTNIELLVNSRVGVRLTIDLNEVVTEVNAKTQAKTLLFDDSRTVAYRHKKTAMNVETRKQTGGIKRKKEKKPKRDKIAQAAAWRAIKRYRMVWDDDSTCSGYHVEEESLGNEAQSGVETQEETKTIPSVRNAGITVSMDVADMDTIPKQIHGDVALMTAQRELCEEYVDIFSRELKDQPAKIPAMTIEVDKDKWEVRDNRRPTRIQSLAKSEETRQQVNKMLAARIIQPTEAAYYSQVLLVKKPNVTWRFCVDYRRLNMATKVSSWPIPNIKELIERLGQKKAAYFAVFDMTKGYYQAPLAASSQPLTAFITHDGVYQWNRVAMGLCGAPSYFQRQMTTKVLAGLMYRCCEVYMDDIIVFGETPAEYLGNLRMVMQALRKHNITANPDKCKMGLPQVEYVGHTINKEGKTFSREKLQKAVDFPRPTTQGELRSWLGLTNYFRDNIRDYSNVAAPLQDKIDRGNYQKSHKVKWDDESMKAFEKLKQLVNNAPMLFFIDHTLPIHLYTDASLIGFGAYLCQTRPDGKQIPIGFMSRTFTDVQMRWSVGEREAYGVYEGVKKFDYLLRDMKFTLHTDHENLTFIRDSGSPKVIRWKLELQEHDFTLVHVPGKDNDVADYMSRNQMAEVDNSPPATTESVCRYLAWMRVKDLGSSAEVNAWHNARYAFDSIPEDAYAKIKAVHNEVKGHHGVDNTINKLNDVGQDWPYRRQHVQRYIEQCDTCQKNDERAIDVNTTPYTVGGYRPMESLNMDHIGPFEADSLGRTHAMVIIDTFSRFVAVYPVMNTSAEEAAKALLLHMGTFLVSPCQIKHDGGAEYANRLVQTLLKLGGIERVETLAYSKEENGIVESCNKRINKFIRDALYSRRQQKNEWSQLIPIATRIHNATIISTIGYAPTDIIFGRATTGDAEIFMQSTRQDNIDAWLTRRLQDQDVIVDLARKNQEKHDTQHLASKAVVETEYAVGSYVLLAWPVTRMNMRRPTKMSMLYRGPYKVTAYVKGIYTLLDLVTGKTLPPKGVHQLKQYNFDPIRTDPQEMAMRDIPDVFLIENVLSHRGNWKRKKSLEFKVRWAGYGPEDDTWESYSTLKDNESLHKYLRINHRIELIPNKIVSEESDVTQNISRATR